MGMAFESGLAFKDEKRNEDEPRYPADVLISFYRKLYSREKHDSPDESRTSMVRRIKNLLLSGEIDPGKILNIGSGPQALEKQLLGNGQESNIREELSKHQFTTIDLADILSSKLLVKNKSNVNHARANCVALPFKDESFNLVVSNHAIDFCPQKEAFMEARRVLKNGGKGIFYLHHPSMLRDIPNNEEIRTFWRYLRDNAILFSSPEEITEFLEQTGFKTGEVSIKSDKRKRDTWWEVEAEKANKEKE